MLAAAASAASSGGSAASSSSEPAASEPAASSEDYNQRLLIGENKCAHDGRGVCVYTQFIYNHEQKYSICRCMAIPHCSINVLSKLPVP